MQKKRYFVIICCLISFIIINIVSIGNGDTIMEEDIDLSENYYIGIPLTVSAEEGVQIRIVVQSSSAIDFYITTEAEYQNLQNNLPFAFGVRELGITDLTDEYELSSPGNYYIILDNSFMDTPPEGDAEIFIKIDTIEPSVPFNSVELFITLAIVIPVILIIAFIFFWALKKKRKKIDESVSFEKSTEVIREELTTQQEFEPETEMAFKVIQPGASWIWIIAIFVILFFGIYLVLNLIGFNIPSMIDLIAINYIYAIIIVGTIVLSIFSWKNLGVSLAYNLLKTAFRKWQLKHKNAIIARLLGLKFRKNSQYYLEYYPNDLNLKNIYSVLRERILEVISICLGISMIVCQIVIILNASTLQSLSDVEYKATIQSYIYLFSIISPLFAFWIIPFIWIVKDLNINGIDLQKSFNNLEETVRGGILSKIIGLAGLVLVFNIIVDANEYISNFDYIVYLVSAIDMLVIVLFFSAIPFLISYLYLSIFHEESVKNSRKLVNLYLPLKAISSTSHENKKEAVIALENKQTKKKTILDSILWKLLLTLGSYYFLVYAIWILIYAG